MKFMKWKTLIITSLVCLAPILLGVLLWNSLPDSMAIHFDMNNRPDNFAPKSFVVFGLPVLMMLLQIFCCFVNDINAKKHGERKKFEKATKWIIPVMTVILQGVTLFYSMGFEMDIRRVAAVIVGVMFLVIGNYLPKLDYVKNYDVESGKARKINRFIGFETVVMGLLYLISIFMPPIATVCCVFLMVPYAVLAVFYGIKIGRS